MCHGAPACAGANARDVLGTTGQGYVDKFNAGWRRAGGSVPTRQAQAAPSLLSPTLTNEAQTQALERQMNMVPPSRQVASADPRADMPAPDAQEAAFYIPPGGGAREPHSGAFRGRTASGRPVQAMSLPSSSTNAPAPVSGSSGRVMTMPARRPAASSDTDAPDQAQLPKTKRGGASPRTTTKGGAPCHAGRDHNRQRRPSEIAAFARELLAMVEP